MSKPVELVDYEDILEHQAKHCVQITGIEEKLTEVIQVVNAMNSALGVLSTVLQRKGVVSPAELMAEIDNEPLPEEGWN